MQGSSEPMSAATVTEELGACSHKVCRVSETCPFSAVAITAPNPRASKAYLDELVNRVGVSGGGKEGTKEVLILAVSDPEGVRIGSGGGTLNAILEIDQALRALDSSENPEGPPQAEAGGGSGLADARVLLVHSGGDSQRSPTQCVCGKAWSALNSCGDEGASTCKTPMDLLLDHLSRLFSGESSSGSPLDPGTLVVTACDVMLLIPPEAGAAADWSFDRQGGVGGAAGLAIAADAAKYAPNHGVYCLDSDEKQETHGITGVSKYLQKPSFQEAEASGAFLPRNPEGGETPGNDSETPRPEVAIDSGVVVFSGAATSALAGLAYSETFKGCTARGVAKGASALRLELYSDLLLALKTGGAAEDTEGGLETYLAGCGPSLPPDHALSKARRETWEALSGFPLGAILLTGATFVHLGTTPELMEMMTLRLPEFIEPYGLTARAACTVGGACSVEDNPPAVVINSRLDGAGVVAGGAVVEHCRLDGDGWEVGAGSLISGVRSIKADHRLRLRSGMCLQQTDLGREGFDEDGLANKTASTSFVVSLFGARDDIKAHYSAEKARVCGATWEAFLRYAGASAEDVWGGIDEADRKLWSARLFPVLTHQEAGNGTAAAAAAVAADEIMWMQNIQEHAAASFSPASPEDLPPPPISGDRDAATIANTTTTQTLVTKKWLAAERLSFKEILARADPGAEFKWRRQLEGEMEVKGLLTEDGVGGGRCRAWDAVAVVSPTMGHLREARRSLGSFAGRDNPTLFCVPPPRPSDPTNTSVPNQGMEWDGPLLLNALLVVAERYSALKRARFGSESSAEALRGMRVLLCFSGGAASREKGLGGVEEGVPGSVGVESVGPGGVWALQRDGSMFVIREESIAPLLELCQRDPQYQGLTYLGADNGIPVPEFLPGMSSTGAATAFDFLIAAAAAARAHPPEPVPSTLAKEPRPMGGDAPPPADAVAAEAAGAGAVAGMPAGGYVDVLSDLEELDERAIDKACTPAGVAQALARVACRLYELADTLGGGGHRSGPGEHSEWQAAMKGLDTLRPLADGRGWGPPIALPASVAALKRLRKFWLGDAGGPLTGGASPTSPETEGATDSISIAELSHTDPHLVVRCARHYERAAAIVVSAAVLTASRFVETPPAEWGQLEAGAGNEEESKGVAGAGEICEELSGDGLGGSDAATAADGGEGSVTGADTSAVEQERRRRKREERQRQAQLQERISRMNPRDQAIARHSQVHVNHMQVAAESAERTQRKLQQERQRWEQQQQQQQQQQQEQQLRQQALPVGASVTSRAAARIDLAGGWTDTPPISYEAGGAVLNAAVTVSGERPVQAKCERIEACSVELVCVGQDGAVTSRTLCSRLEDFADFCVPQAPAALLKAALICAGIVRLPPAAAASSAATSATDLSGRSDNLSSLEEQLGRVFGCGGIRITTRSGLPQGSGMGTSSILAGVVLSAACVAAGRPMSSTSLVHAVLRVEQLMTAGGGHQDQVGGLLGGVKICRTAASLPLQVLVEPVPLDAAFEKALNDRLVLVFTGKQRLARDLLQGVVRGWHDRLPGTVNTVKGLVSNAEDAANACRGNGDLESLGRCLSTYWEQKKRMAPGAEPPAVKALLDKMRPLCHGLSVCGAGGGGFVACITKSPGDQGMKEVTDALAPSSVDPSEVSTVSVHRGRLDQVGMEVSVELPVS